MKKGKLENISPEKKFHIKKWNQFKVNETSEFNFQRLNPDTVRASVHVDDPSLSINAFDKHEDIIRNAISKLGTLTKALQNTTGYRALKSKLSLDDQSITNLKIIRIVKNTALKWDVYLNFKIDETEYWGVITDIMTNPQLKSEVFKDFDLLQTKEWIIKTSGLIIKTVKNWLKPQFGKFKLIADDIICISSKTGKQLILPSGSVIEVLKSYDDRLIFEYESEQYTLNGDNFIYFNWWFDPIS